MESNVVLRGHRLLIKPDPIEEVSKGGIVIAKPGNQAKQELRASEKGTVLQVGATCWHNYDYKDDAWEPWCKVGDHIAFVKYAGKFITVDNEQLLIIQDEDVLAVLKEEPSAR